MVSSALVLRLLLDVVVAAGLAPNLREAKNFIEQKTREHAAAEPTLFASSTPCPAACPLRDPGRQAALDGLAGAFVQIGEHFELLATLPPEVTTTPSPSGAVL